MQANEWVAFGGGIIGGVLGLAVIVGFLYRRVIHPLNVLITRELSPNGGKSMKDDVANLKATASKVELMMEAYIYWQNEHIRWSQAQTDRYDQHMKEFHGREQ